MYISEYYKKKIGKIPNLCSNVALKGKCKVVFLFLEIER